MSMNCCRDDDGRSVTTTSESGSQSRYITYTYESQYVIVLFIMHQCIPNCSAEEEDVTPPRAKRGRGSERKGERKSRSERKGERKSRSERTRERESWGERKGERKGKG